MQDVCFHCVSCQIYIPAITVHQIFDIWYGYQSEAASPQEETNGEADKESPVKSSELFTIRDELLNRTIKFLGLVNTTLQQLQIQGLFY